MKHHEISEIMKAVWEANDELEIIKKGLRGVYSQLAKKQHDLWKKERKISDCCHCKIIFNNATGDYICAGCRSRIDNEEIKKKCLN